jgi:hypothetical protein
LKRSAVASDYPEGTLRDLLDRRARDATQNLSARGCLALLYVVQQARIRNVPVRQVESAFEGDEAEALYQSADPLLNVLSLADQEAPQIVAELEERLPEILNPPRPFGETV